MENVLSSWAWRTLSYGGRALVINALALSRVWFVASLIHMPGWVHSELSKLIFKFFWKGKPDVCFIVSGVLLVLLVLWLMVVFSCPPSEFFLFACCCLSPPCFLVLVLCFYGLSCASHSKPAFVLD